MNQIKCDRNAVERAVIISGTEKMKNDAGK